MQRRNRPRDDKETVSRLDANPQSTSQREQRSRRRTRPKNRDIQITWNLLRIALFMLLIFIVVEYLASTSMMGTEDSTNANRPLRSHDRHRETSGSRWGLNKTFNQSTDCSLEPIPGYPMQFNLLQLLDVWPIDDMDGFEARQDSSYQSLCVFQWSSGLDRDKMDRYRKLELPFIITGDPQVLEGKKET